MRSVIASKNIQTKKECDLSHSFLVCAPIPLAQVNNRICLKRILSANVSRGNKKAPYFYDAFVLLGSY